jgi:hypothetical protein
MINLREIIAELNDLVNPKDKQSGEGGLLDGFCDAPTGSYGLYCFVGRSATDPYSCWYYLDDNQPGKDKEVDIEQDAVLGVVKEVFQTARKFKRDLNQKLVFKVQTASGKTVSIDTGRGTVFARGVVQSLMSLYDEGYDFTEKPVYITVQPCDDDEKIVFGGALRADGSYANGRDYKDYDTNLADLIDLCGTGHPDGEDEDPLDNEAPEPSGDPDFDDIPF